MKHSSTFATYGEPARNVVSGHVLQAYSDSCAIKSQQLVLEKFGIHLTEDQLVTEAIQHGWYTPGIGTPMNCVGRLLQLHGVEMHQYVNCNICNVLNELAMGHQVIMSVDSGELCHYGLQEHLEDHTPGVGGPDHALIVSGINVSNPNDVKVIVTDPGTGDLCKEYPLAQFVDAANDSNFFMVTTDRTVPNVFDTFGAGVDHLPMVGNMTYDYFRDNYAFLHDVAGRPVFEEFMTRLHAPVIDAFVTTTDLVPGDDGLDDGWGTDAPIDIDDIDDIDGFDDIDLDF